MSYELLPNLKTRYFDSNGEPLAGGFLYSYLGGTVTPASTYSDYTGNSFNPNPVTLDANGEAVVFIPSGIAYKFILTDSADVVQWTQDNVYAAPSGVAYEGPWTEHAVTDGQAATNLLGETLDLSVYSSCVYDCEIIRGTTVIANGSLAIQSVNGTGRVVVGGFICDEDHGVTFSVSQVSTTVQLKAALDTGAGSGTIKLTRKYVAA